jgi:hypothetical protein
VRRWALPLALLLAGCGAGSSAENAGQAAAAPDLESAAVARGLVRDPATTDLAGLYARDTDRLCIVPAGMGHAVGAFVDYGDRITCSASGRIARAGATVHVELGGDGRCSFDASYDGDVIRFPGALPAGCARLCAGRASYAGLTVRRLSDSIAEAQAMRDPAGRRLCGG